MEPVVYDFRINPHGTFATLDAGTAGDDAAALLHAPGAADDRRGHRRRFRTIAGPTSTTSPTAARRPAELLRVFRTMINHLFPVTRSADDVSKAEWDAEAAADPPRQRLRPRPARTASRRPPARADRPGAKPPAGRPRRPRRRRLRADPGPASRSSRRRSRRGEAALQRGEVAVVTLAAGVGSRWTTGAGVVKAVNPFVDLDGRHRSFLEIHLAKTRKAAARVRSHDPPRRDHQLPDARRHRAPPASPPATTATTARSTCRRGRSIGQRLIPMTRDLTFLWEEASHETLDENKQKVRDAGRRAILDWARSQGEGTDYTDNVPIQRFNPPGHFYEVPNLLRQRRAGTAPGRVSQPATGCWSTTSTPWARPSTRACWDWRSSRAPA